MRSQRPVRLSSSGTSIPQLRVAQGCGTRISVWEVVCILFHRCFLQMFTPVAVYSGWNQTPDSMSRWLGHHDLRRGVHDTAFDVQVQRLPRGTSIHRIARSDLPHARFERAPGCGPRTTISMVMASSLLSGLDADYCLNHKVLSGWLAQVVRSSVFRIGP